MRFALRELTPRRIADAASRRVRDLPHAISWRTSEYARTNRQRLMAFRDRHRKQRCFILGNGPSLGRMDLSPLCREVTFGMNRIYLLFDRMNFVPTYYTCVNELVIEQYHHEIGALSVPKFIPWNSRGLFAADAPDLHFVRTGLGLSDYFERDLSRTLCTGGTVTFVALEIAYYMGFEEVVLIGVDHHFVDKGTPNRSEIRTAECDVNHFHPQYFPRGSRWQLPDLRRSELAYARAKTAFAKDGRRIIDATLGGRCDVFQKARFEDLCG